MKLVPACGYANWLAEAGLIQDPVYPGSKQLVFKNTPVDLWRAWETPKAASDLPGFASSLMSAVAPHGPFVLCPRGNARWFTGVRYGAGPTPDQLRDRIVGTLAIPEDHDGAVEFDETEWRDVQMLILTFLVYSWNIGGDLEVVAGDRSCVLMTSHHSYVAVHCFSPERLEQFEASMLANGYRAEGADESSAQGEPAG